MVDLRRFFIAVFATACLIVNVMPSYACISDAQRNEEILAYYQALRVKCAGNSCCLASVSRMKENGFEEAKDGKCPEGVDKDMLKCVNSLQWCRKHTMVLTFCIDPV